MTESTTSNLTVNEQFRSFVDNDLLPATDISADDFWSGLQTLIDDLTPINRQLLADRDALQEKIDAWHSARDGQPWNAVEYRAFLEEIGYLQPEGKAFEIDTQNVDAEVARIAGPQLVVPVSNARFALNAANARWGSLYDALYGTDVIPSDEGREAGRAYNPKRGAAVIRYAEEFLDRTVPLAEGSHTDVVKYQPVEVESGSDLTITLENGKETRLADPQQYVGHFFSKDEQRLLLRNNGLHLEIHIDHSNPVGSQSPSGVCDIVMESALTTIQDCEDSVAAVDASDKIAVYRNWLGLMSGTLTATFKKGKTDVVRELQPDRDYLGADGNPVILPGRSLMLVRNVGHLMTTDAVLDSNGDEVFEGILDAVITTACAIVDLKQSGKHRNSRTGSVYIVKPKMHGPAEAAFANTLFDRVEDLLGLERHTVKIGVMDEERRTTVNLAECIRAVRHRIVFINTGSLDRTGDEIHTSMLAGPVLRKDDIKQEPWIQAYEDWNVDIGIRCGFPGRAQIGKGMWPKPDEMKQMVDTKAAHPKAGANCAWVP